jgi:S1-C subfamily serine protease
VSLASRRDGGSGAVITAVEPDSPAANAGFRVDDVVVAVNGTAVSGAADLVGTIRDFDPGRPSPRRSCAARRRWS